MKFNGVDFEVGKNDPLGNVIINIEASGPNYVIYTVENDIVRYSATTELVNRCNQLKQKAVDLKQLAGSSKSLKKICNSAIIQAHFLVCSGENVKDAKSLLNSEEKRVRRLKNIQGKLYYLLGAMILVAINILIMVIVNFIQLLSQNSFYLLLVAVCGSLGSFLSISLNLNKIDVDIEASWLANAISSMSRILIGMIGALLVYFLIKANIVFGLISESNSDYAIFASCILAGFSETLIPNILRKIETQQ